MPGNAGLTLDKSEEDWYDEEWLIKINSGGEYTLSKNQAAILQQEIAMGNRGIIMFKTFSISIPYISEFYMVKRFLKESLQLPESASEEPYVPISADRWETIKKEAYKKIGMIK